MIRQRLINSKMKSHEERMAIVRKIAQRLLSKYSLCPPVDVFALAELEKLCIKYEGNQVGIDGLAQLDAEPPIITLNSEQTYRPRIRFTLAHEIGHVKIPWHTGVIGCSTDNPYVYVQAKKQIDSQELEANAFASELLIPREWLQQKVDIASDFSTLLDQIMRETGASAMACFYALEDALPPGHMIYVTTPSMDYWKSFRTTNTYTWSAGYQDEFQFLDAVCLKNDRFEKGSYTINHYALQPCPNLETLPQIYQMCNQDLGELLNAVTNYHPEQILHCLNLVLLNLPDEFSLFIEPYAGESLIRYHTPKCHIRLPEQMETYEELKVWVIESREPYGELVLAGGKRLFWIVQRKYAISAFKRMDSKQLLRQLIGRYYIYPEDTKVLRHVNGVIGSANTKNVTGGKELFCQLKARFSQDDEVRAMIEDPDFDSFLVNRISEIIARRQSK